MRWLVASLFLLSAPQVAAQEPQPPASQLVEVDDIWAACNGLLARTDWRRDQWTGWKRDVGDGYGDNFQFWDGGGQDVSVLREQRFIDGIYTEVVTSCFRKSGILAFVLVEGSSPNMAGRTGPVIKGTNITRQGRIYIGPGGNVLRVSRQIVDEGGERIADNETPTIELARECGPIDLHKSVDRVVLHETSELGDIYGKRPRYKPNNYDWCAAVKP